MTRSISRSAGATAMPSSAAAAAARRQQQRCGVAQSSATAIGRNRKPSPSPSCCCASAAAASHRASVLLAQRRARRGPLSVAAAESGEGEGATTSDSSSSSSSSSPSTSDASTTTPAAGKTTSAADNGDDRIMTSTLSALDALLGIDPEVERKKKEQEEEEERRRQKQRDEESGKPPISISVSPEVLKALAEAEAARNNNGASSSASTPEEKKKAEEAARKLQEELLERLGSDPASGPLRGLLLRGATPKDLAQIKDAAFGPRVFWVTESSPLDPFLADGWLIRGNLRSRTCAEALAHVTAEVTKLFGDKYTVLMIDDPGSADGSDTMEALLDEATGGMSRSPARQSGTAPGGGSEGGAEKEGAKRKPEPRVAFQIVLSEAARPPPPPTWQPLAAAVLGALSLGSSVQLGMAANVFRLPPAVLEWLADPAGLAAAPDGSLPPFVAEFDPGPFIASAAPIAAAVIAIQLAHEAGHLSVAFSKKFKVGLPLLVPNGQLGTFGAVTQLRSLAEDRQSLYDFAAAGPFAGGAVAAALFLAGLAMSTGGGGGGGGVVDATSGLIPVPAALLQGSLLLGGLTQAVLGSGTSAAAAAGAGAAAAAKAAGGAAILVHPLLVAGWAGLVTTALNLLPVGRLDGGRMVQAAFGRTPLAAMSFFTYVGLALGFLGSALALPFGLYVLICQRDPENSPRDGVTEPSHGRQLAAAVAIGVALLVLLPAAPDVAGDALSGGGMFL